MDEFLIALASSLAFAVLCALWRFSKYLWKRSKPATFHVYTKDRYLFIENDSLCCAYNLDMTPSSKLFLTCSFTKQKCVEPSRRIEVRVTRLTSNTKSGSITLKWTNKKGNKKYEKTYPVYF